MYTCLVIKFNVWVINLISHMNNTVTFTLYYGINIIIAMDMHSFPLLLQIVSIV